MANEIQTTRTTGQTLYALLWNAVGQVWNGATFVAYDTGDIGDYDIPLTELGTASQRYAGDMPAVAAGIYHVSVYQQAGGSPAEGDTIVVADTVLDWSGTAVVGLATSTLIVGSIAANAITATAIAADAITAAKIADDAITSDQLADDAITADKIASNAIAAAKIATDAITADKIAADAITADKIAADAIAAAKIASGAITAAKFAAGAVDAAALAADAANEIADALLSRSNGIETGYTPKEALRVILAVLAGKCSISGNTVTFRDVGDSANRVVATTDVQGQRSAVTLTV